MVSRKRRRTTWRRKRVGNRKRRGGSGVYTKILRQPVPDKTITRLRYSQLVPISMGPAYVVSSYIFQSSIYDPDFSGLGHQPLWRDQIISLYDRYRVHGIKYKFTIVNTNVNQMITGVVKQASIPALETDLNTMRERNNVQRWTAHAYTSTPIYVTGYMPTGRPWGLTKKDFLADEGFESVMTTNPLKQSYLEIYAATSNTSAKIDVMADLVYYVEFTSRTSVVGS